MSVLASEIPLDGENSAVVSKESSGNRGVVLPIPAASSSFVSKIGNLRRGESVITLNFANAARPIVKFKDQVFSYAWAFVNAVLLLGAMYVTISLMYRGVVSVERDIELSIHPNDAILSESSGIIETTIFNQMQPRSGVDIRISEEGGHVFSLDTGMALYTVWVNLNRTRALAIGGHRCVTENDVAGVVASECPLRLFEFEGICTEGCLVPVGENQVATLNTKTFTMENYYETKNSLGFSVSKVVQHILCMKLSSSESKLTIRSRLDRFVASNAQPEFGYWQDICFIVFGMIIVTNLLARLALVPMFAKGVKVQSNRLFIKTDLAGGMVTTPGLQIVSWLFLVICTMHYSFWEDASLHEVSSFSHIAVTASVTSTTATLITVILQETRFKCTSTGTLVFVFGGIARLLTLHQSQTKANAIIVGLGQVIRRECATKLYDQVNQTLLASANNLCTTPDKIGMSGMEILIEVYLATFLVTLGFTFAFEVTFRAVELMKHNLVQESVKVAVISSSSSGSGSSSFRAGYVAQCSSFEAVIRLHGQSVSVFSRKWAAPLRGIDGRKWYHASAIVENNLILWGPCLIRLRLLPVVYCLSLFKGKQQTVEFLLHYKLFVGVMDKPFHVLSTRHDLEPARKYLKIYDYKSMSRLFNPLPLR